MNVDEAKLKRKEWTAKRAEAGYTTATNRIAAAVQKKTGMETRVCIPGHMQRGGSPAPTTVCWPPSSAAMLHSWWRWSATA